MSYPRVSESNLGGTRLSRYPNTIPQRLFGANSIIVRFGDVENAVYHPPTYFDNTYLEEWITDSRTREMVRDVDKSEVISARAIDSPYLGSISVREISGGERKDERQIAILGLAHERERVTSADVGELLGVSQPRARAIVLDMLEAGLFKRRGEGRTTYYEPAHPQQ